VFIFVVREFVTQGGGEGRGEGFVCLCGLVVVPSVLWATGSCVVRKHTPYLRLVASGEWRVATGFISPPKFCFTPEPVYLNTKRRRQSSVPFSGHSSRAV
jgi:hypothetical protein